MFKFTDPEKLKDKVLEASKWLTVQEFCQRAPEVNDLLLLEKWKKEAKIFSVVNENVELIPEYVFDQQGNLRPTIQKILHLFEGKRSPLEIAIWFICVNGWLDGNTPINWLETYPEFVLEAARMEAFPSDHC
jgi:hypothetical protein